MPSESDVIAGRYRVEREIGRGGMGAVWLCRDEVLGRSVAVKEVGHLPGQPAPDLARALREARSSAALHHPNVVAVFDAVNEGERIWLVMEYVPGRTLAEMTAAGPIDPVVAAEIGAQVADGLAAAHALGTVHRDVKPSNILVVEDDMGIRTAKITDFGIARTLGEGQLTETGLVTGTPSYFSPEQARGELAGPAADVWALGATLYAAVEGRSPWPDERNPLALLARIGAEAPPRPERAGPLAAAIDKMMERDPQARWSMARATEELRRVARGEQTAPVTPADPDRTAVFAAPAVAAPVEEASPADVPTGAWASDEPVTPMGLEEPERERRFSRGVLVALGLLAAILLTVGVVYATGGDDDDTAPTADETTSGPASPKPRKSKSASTTATSEPAAPTTAPEEETTEPTPEETEAPPAASGSPEEFVQDYYALLPSDTESAWQMLSSEMQAEVGSYEDYDGFWSTVDSVTVDDTSSSGDTVEVALTYVTDRGSESEVRQLQLGPGPEGSYLITGDAVVG